MKIHKGKLTTLFIMGIVLLILTIACQPAEKPNPDDMLDSEDKGNTSVKKDDNTLEGDVENNSKSLNTLGNRAESIADSIVDLKGINDASVVITGNTALVGVDIGKQSEGAMTDDLKKRVQDAAKKVDREIDRVVVTADTDIFQRIDNVAHNINRGEPVSGFTKEIEEMINRIAPSVE